MFLGTSGYAQADFEKPLTECRSQFPSGNGSNILASDNDNIYLSNVSTITAIRTSEITPVWTTVLPFEYKSPGVVTGNALSFVAGSGEHSELLTANTSTGLISSRLLLPNFETKAMPKLISLPKSLIAVYDTQGHVSVVEPATQAIRWSSRFGTEVISVQSSTTSLWIAGREKAVEVSISTGQPIREIAFEKGNATVFLFLNDGRFAVGKADGQLSLMAGSRSWRMKTGGRISSLTRVENDILVTSHDNFAYLVAGRNGAVIWKKRIGGRVIAEPLVVGSSTVIQDSLEGTALIVGLGNGRTLNRISAGDGRIFKGPAVFAGERLLFSTNSGLAIFGISGCK